MKGIFGLTLSVAVTLALVLQLSHYPVVDASRAADVTSMEVSGSHFVAQKKEDRTGSRTVLSEIREHRDEPSQGEITNEMRQKIAAFSKLAVQALANGDNPDMSHEEKAQNVQLALAQATNAMASLASHADIVKNPVLAQKLSNLQALSSPSLIQKREEHASGVSGARMTAEMREQVAAFSDVAVQALANGHNADMSHEEQAEHVQAALAKAANVMASMASMVDVKKNLDLAEKVAHLKELTAPSLIQQDQEYKLGNTRSAKITPDMHQNVIAFGKAAAEALANGRNIAMTPEAKAQSTQAALAQAAKAILSITSAADTKNSPELAQKLARLEELVSPSLIQKHEEPDRACPKADPDCSRRKIKDLPISSASSCGACARQEIRDDEGQGTTRTWSRCKPDCDIKTGKTGSSKSGSAAASSGGSSQTGAKKTGGGGGASSTAGAKTKKAPRKCPKTDCGKGKCCFWKGSPLPGGGDKMECKAEPCAWKPEMAKWDAAKWADWQKA